LHDRGRGIQRATDKKAGGEFAVVEFQHGVNVLACR
jgi:hypothetical protein